MEVHNANLNIRIPIKLRERLVQVAKENELTPSYVIREMISDYVQKEGKLELFKNVGKK